LTYYKSNVSGIVYKRDGGNWWSYRDNQWKSVIKTAFWLFQFIACEEITKEEACVLLGENNE